MEEDGSAYTEVGESFQGFCCMAKQYFSNKTNLIDTLEITPRVLIYKRRLKSGAVYQQSLYIRNNGMFARRLKYETDSPLDTTIDIQKNKQIEDLQSNQAIYINIDINPTDKSKINRRRHIYIISEHPNIIFEVPIIIVVDKQDWPSIPEIINFPPTISKSKTFYEFIVYNPKSTAATAIVKTLNPLIEIDGKSNTIPKNDYIKVLLTLTVKDMRNVKDVIKLKYAPSKWKNNIREDLMKVGDIICRTTTVVLPFEHKPIRNSLYLSTQHIAFEESKFERNTQKEFRACNESSENPIQYMVRFLTEIYDLEPETIAETDLKSEPEIAEQEQPISEHPSVEEGVIKEPVYAQDVLDINSFRHFGVNSKGGQIKAKCSNKFILTFHPLQDDDCNFDDDAEPPFLVSTKVFFEIKDELSTIQKQMFVSGLISGPEVEIKPKSIDTRIIYLGEEYCEQIVAQNIDGQVNAKVFFKDYKPMATAVCNVSPEDGFHLEPCQKGVFLLTIFTLTTGKFSIKIRFKVLNGKHYNLILRGSSHSVEPKMYPPILELGNLPIAVPYKCRVLLMNPLAVPMTLHINTMDDGTELPLVLDVKGTSNLLPVTVKNPVKTVDSIDDPYDPDEFPEIVITKKAPSLYTIQSARDSIVSSHSSKFEEDVLDKMPQVASTMISNFKNIKIVDKNNVEKKLIKDAMRNLIELDYFHDLSYSNYKHMNWNALPSDPREIYVDSEVVYLQPNTGRKITVLVIPNTVGSCHRYIQIRGCPIFQLPVNESESELSEKQQTLVDSTLMLSKLWIEYDCQVPDVEWTEEVTFDGRIIYAGEAYSFLMLFDNTSTIGGFLYYDVVPGGKDGEMYFVDNTWKFYLPENYVIYSYCAVIFKKLGDVRLSGLMKIVGYNVGKPFHITAHVLPNRVHVSPKSIHRKMRVLQTAIVYIYITNITPTRTWLTLSLKNDDFQFIEPEGGILGPTGHGIYVTLYTKFYDPEYYRNTLYVNVRNGHMMEIPITFDIWGMPISFEPNIKEGLNTGIILTNSEADFNADMLKFTKDIKVINRGYRFYRLIIQKTKSGVSNNNTTPCTLPETKARMSICPKTLLMAPFSEDFIQISSNSCEETTIYNEFRIEIVDQLDKKRVESIRFVATAKFIYPELVWSKKELTMVYCRTHRQKERLKLELVKLINIADVGIENVNLKIVGPFKARELFEHRFKKQLDFKIGGAEKKELTVFLNKAAITDKFCTHVDGRIFCVANDKMQRSLKLRVIIRNPELKITQTEIILFTNNSESTTFVQLENDGCLEASYKWKKMHEATDYVGERDDAKDFASEILSEIFRMLELGECDEESEMDSIYERNMTLRYQKYRCKLLNCRPPDPIGVEDILTEIIDNLDLEHKRWIVRLNDDDTERNSMGSYVEKTLDRILNALQIEDSFEISEVSSEACDMERTIYFYEKKGVLEQQQKEKCLVHLPGVRKGYAHQALFQLDVVGGTSHQLQIIVVNMEKTVELSRDNIYLGMRPWYEQYSAGVKIQNVTNFTINIMLNLQQLVEKPRRKKCNRIADGYTDIATEQFYNMPHMGTKLMRFTGIMGFSEEFIREIKLVINDGEERLIRLRGQGIMPIFSVISNLERIEQDQVEVAFEYELMKRIYYFDVFKGITEEDDEPVGVIEESEEHAIAIVNDFSDISIISLSGSSVSSRTAERRLYKLLKTYVMVINNAEMPNATILEQLLATEKFLEDLRVNFDTCILLNMVYQSYVKVQEAYDPKMPFSLKHFTIQSLPFKLHGHILNMGTLRINQFHKFEIDLHFFGPGKLRAAARTVIKIPGLVVDFSVQEGTTEENYDFVFYSSEATDADFLSKSYRNMYEREIDLDTDPKLKHAHSFDVNERLMHQRFITARERKILMSHYNSLNKSVYLERKHHLILSKVYSKCKKNFSGTKLRIVVLIKPKKKFYEDGQLIEDYIYIDLHMGPTLPILLRGMIKF